METDYGKILAYCEEYGSITVREAFVKLEINSPRKVISDLRKKGFEVRAVPQDNNGKTPYNRYYISKKVEE